MKQGTVKIGKILSYIAIALVFVAVCGFLAYFTGGFTSDFKTFYAVVDGKEVLTMSEGHIMETNKPLKVDIKYTFGAVNKEVSGYSVKVVPNPVQGKDFDFTLDGNVYSFQAVLDLTAGFEFEQAETSFTVKPKGGVTEILQAVYPESKVEDCSDKAYTNMFTLVITSHNSASSVTLKFSVVAKVSEITLDKEVIEF